MAFEGAALGSTLGGIGGVLGAVGGILGKGKKDKSQPNVLPPFRGPVVSPNFTLAGGVLSRRPQVGGVPDQENRLRELLDASRAKIEAFRGQGLGGTLTAIQQAETQLPGFFAQTGQLRGDIRDLMAQVEPGFGRLTETRVEGIRDRASAAVGNLRAELNNRNMLGSSFAQNQLSNLALDFTREEDTARAESFVAEMAFTDQLIGRSGELLQLDQATMNQQIGLLGTRLGLDERITAALSLELQSIQEQRAVTAAQAERELGELGLATNFLADVDQITTAQSQALAQAALDQVLATSPQAQEILAAQAQTPAPTTPQTTPLEQANARDAFTQSRGRH